jgi:hypothetical protein
MPTAQVLDDSDYSEPQQAQQKPAYYTRSQLADASEQPMYTDTVCLGLFFLSFLSY